LAPGGGGESSNDTISARLGITAVYGPLIGRPGTGKPRQSEASRRLLAEMAVYQDFRGRTPYL